MQLPFNEWRVSPRLNMTPRTQEAARSGVDLESIYLRRLTTHTVQLFPADHSTVCLRSMGKPIGDAVEAGSKADGVVGKSDVSWLSVYHEGHVFGLRHPEKLLPLVNGDKALPEESSKARRGSKAGVDAGYQNKPLSEVEKLARYRKTGDFSSWYVGDFEGGVRVVACEGALAPRKPDNWHTVTLRHTFPSGLIVSNCSDGTVRMDVVNGGHVSVFGDKVSEELCRIVRSRGTVIRHLRDGSTHILYADGSSSFKESGEEGFTETDIGTGLKRKKEADPFDGKVAWREVGTVPRTVEIDPETKAEVTTLSFGENNKTRQIKNMDGSVLVVHSEGTVVRSAPKIPDEDGVLFHPKYLVEAKGFAAVEVDIEVDQQAAAFANGEEVAISKGGDCVRTVTAFPDGSYALTTFDSRITSPVNGRVIAVRPDRTELIASDDGVVTHRCRSLWTGNDSYECELIRRRGVKDDGSSKKKKKKGNRDDPDAQPDPDLVTQCYVFNLRDGKMSTRDNEHNLFEAWLGKDKTGEVNVELAGVLQPDVINDGMKKVPAVVNRPIEPRLFVIGRDGSGTEILREYDTEDWERRVKNESYRLQDLTKDESEGR